MPATQVVRHWILIGKAAKPELVLALRDRIELNQGHAQVALVKAYLVPSGKDNPLEEANDCILAVEFNNATGCCVNNASSTIIHMGRLRVRSASFGVNIGDPVYFPLRESDMKLFHLRLSALDGVRLRPLRLRQDATIVVELAFRHLASIGDPIRECQKSMQSLIASRPFSHEYPMDLRAAMEGRWSPTKCKMDEREMIHLFENEDRNWREGRVKTSFCYLLIDPRLAKEASNKSLSMNERFGHFIESIFYVGKGKATRPFRHLIDAAQAQRQYPELASVKTKKILELWQLSAGVLPLNVFLNIMPVEAYTREAAMIEAIGVANLTNVKRGTFYGAAAIWNSAKYTGFGILCLQKAFEQFQVDGKRPLFPRDVI